MKILVLTSKYPSSESIPGFTPVVHYFAKEWVKQGHQVKVVHNQSKFPNFFFLIPSYLKKFMESRLGFTFPVKSMSTAKSYILDNVNVSRILIFRLLPFVPYSNFAIRKQIKKIIQITDNEKFNPDIIISHWTYPQLPIMVDLKKEYNCQTALIFHTVDVHRGSKHQKFQKMVDLVDYIGFRSTRLKDDFLKLYSIQGKSFLCYSGVKESFIIAKNLKTINKKLSRFIYVGTFIKRKYIDSILHFLSNSNYDNFNLKVIGDGPERKFLETLTNKLNISASVNYPGQLTRNEVLQQMELAECFIMISSNEVFGLVYLEAMAKGCLVVASRNEGMDGIITHGQNGFLCSAGNIAELENVIKQINELSVAQKISISNNAIDTARNFSESIMATKYLENFNLN